LNPSVKKGRELNYCQVREWVTNEVGTGTNERLFAPGRGKKGLKKLE